jgi:hypothetical protein
MAVCSSGAMSDTDELCGRALDVIDGPGMPPRLLRRLLFGYSFRHGDQNQFFESKNRVVAIGYHG